MFIGLDMRALIVAGVVFLIAAGVAFALKRFDIKDGIVIVTLLILPAATYGIVSGYIAEISAPGGWGAKFRELAAQNIEPTPLAAEIEDLSIVEKSGLAALDERRATLVPGKPVAMTLQLGRRDYYSDSVIAAYARTLLTFDPKLTVIFVDENGRFVASSSGTSVMAAMQSGEQGSELVNAIENADLLRIKDLVGQTTNSVTVSTSNTAALAVMLRDGVESIVAIDDMQRPIGVVRRDDIVARLIVKLSAD